MRKNKAAQTKEVDQLPEHQKIPLSPLHAERLAAAIQQRDSAQRQMNLVMELILNPDPKGPNLSVLGWDLNAESPYIAVQETAADEDGG